MVAPLTLSISGSAYSPPASRGGRRLRVMQITHDLGVGGLEQVIVTLCRTMDRERFEPLVLCLRGVGPLGDRLAGTGAPIHELAHTPGRPDYLACRDVARVLREQRIDVVHTHNTHAFVDGGLGAMLAGVRTRVHTDHARAFPDKLRYMVAEHVLSWTTDHVVGVSTHTVENLVRYERIPRRKLTTIINGIETQVYSRPIDRGAKLRALGLPADALVVGAAARMTEQKGLTYLLQATAALCDRTRPFHVLIAGEDRLGGALQAEAATLGIADRVHFLGLRMDIPELLQVMDVYALPSLWEGLPMAILEAMAAGCAIVATDVGGVGTAVRDGVTGRLVPAGDVPAFADAMAALLGDPGLRARLAEAARLEVERRFSAEAMTRQYERLYAGRAGVPA